MDSALLFHSALSHCGLTVPVIDCDPGAKLDSGGLSGYHSDVSRPHHRVYPKAKCGRRTVVLGSGLWV